MSTLLMKMDSSYLQKLLLWEMKAEVLDLLRVPRLEYEHDVGVPHVLDDVQ